MSERELHLAYIRRCLDLARLSPPKPTNFRVGSILLQRRPKSKLAETTKTTSASISVRADKDHESSSPSSSCPPQILAVKSEVYDDTILSTGYTLELVGNTHAEQCCLAKYRVANAPAAAAAAVHNDSHRDESDASCFSSQIVLYVTMEPCGKRLSGNDPCAKRIASTRSSPSEYNGISIDKVYFGVKEPGTFVGQSIGCKLLDEAGVDWELVRGLEREILDVATEGHVKSDEEREREKVEAEATRIGQEDISPKERERQKGGFVSRAFRQLGRLDEICIAYTAEALP
ncbi:hypothetical protein KEM54_005177 [Ascosphaera aggregata]|nr:hypothetical protein KEM54_005177 [Ascosphaera aggregata]